MLFAVHYVCMTDLFVPPQDMISLWLWKTLNNQIKIKKPATRCIVIGCGPLRFYTQGAQDITKTCSLGHTDPGTLVRNFKKRKSLSRQEVMSGTRTSEQPVSWSMKSSGWTSCGLHGIHKWIHWNCSLCFVELHFTPADSARYYQLASLSMAAHFPQSHH